MAEDRFQKGVLPGIKQPGQKKVSMQEGEQAQTRFRPSPYQPPCHAVPPPSTPPAPPPGGEPSYTDLIQRILDQQKIFADILARLNETSRGVTSMREIRYYNTPQTAIQVATPNPATGQTLDPELLTNGVNPGYQAERVYVQLQRIAPQISVINDGNTAIYVITTPDGTNWSPEAAILVGEARRFFNVWELKLRSTVAGNVSTSQGGVYRVTEYEYSLAYTSTVLFNRTALTIQSLQNIALPAVGTQLPNITIPNGFSLAIRATPGNTGNVFVATSAANLNVATTRATLSAGDSLELYISNANLVWVAGSIAAQNVDLIVEQ